MNKEAPSTQAQRDARLRSELGRARKPPAKAIAGAVVGLAVCVLVIVVAVVIVRGA